MTWNPHISYTTSKPNQKLGFIKRNLKGNPQQLKRLAYISLVRSEMEYASTVWDQRRAARWITSSHDQTTSVTALLQQLQLESLERRRVNWLAFLYKILNEQVAVPPVKLDIIMNNRPVRGSVTQQRLHIPRCRTTEFQKSFTPRTIPDWNSLPNAITSAASVSSFRSQLTTSVMSLHP